MKNHITYDVLIIGGGISACVFASETSPRACAGAAAHAGRRFGAHCGLPRGGARTGAAERARAGGRAG